MTDLTIPSELKPVDGRFGAGPSKVRAAQVAALSEMAPTYLGTSHRKPGVKNQVKRVREGLRTLFTLPEGYEVVLGNGGSTAFWDIATFGLIEDRAQFLSFGEFGSKFAKAAATAVHLGEQDVRTFAPGSAGAFEPVPGLDAYASPHNETSTGVAIQALRPQGVGDALVMFDATSAAGGLPVVAQDFDVYYFAPQKCFASDGGLWFALMSPAALERAAAIKASGRWMPAFLDINIAIENSVQEQTYNTPALATIALMAEQIDWFNDNGGLAWTTARTAESAAILYDWHCAHGRECCDPLRLGTAHGVHIAVCRGPCAALGGDRHHRLRRRGRRGRGRQDSASQRHRGRRAVPQAGAQPIARGHVPGDRPLRCRRADGQHRLGG
ncbi:MAG: phosphoserine transaminase [Candidatus Nanopelagicales bacterium]|nr:phosphoserine transaminase [Candidatus Nanopelagicales bacterium]